MAERYINAAKDGYLDVLQQATRRDLNMPDEDGMTAVIWAAHNGHLDALRLIVGRGGDVDRSDYLGLTALHHAAQKGLMHVLTYLVNWGANIYALDNNHHSAFDIASLWNRTEVVQYLDQVYSQQQNKNPKHASRLKEDAVRQAERNIRRYEKLQEEAARRAQKEQRKLTSVSSHDGSKNGAGQAQGKNLIKALTMAIRGKPHGKSSSAAGKSYSDIAGLTQSVGSRSSEAKRLSQHGGEEMNGDRADVKAHAIRSLTSDVLYMSGERSDTAISADPTSSRRAVYDVFGGEGHSFKGRSEVDTRDSGVDSYFGDEEDEESAPGIFNRPGFGKTAFLTSSNFLNTLPSFEVEGDEGAAMNGYSGEVNGQDGVSTASRDLRNGEKVGAWTDPRELPWDQEEVDTLDDDDEATTTSAIEIILWSAGLEAYLHRFLQEKVDMDILLKMSDADLKEIGLPFGPRRRLLDAVKRRQEVLSLPRHMTDSFL